jgi:predicted metal-binding protein
MEEVWSTIKEFNKYEASNLGRIRNKETKKIKNPSIRKRDGYLEVSLQRDGKQYTKTVHRLVAETFIDNPDNKYAINHIDGNKQNNNINNLEYCTKSENELHKHNVLGIQVRKIKCTTNNIIYNSIAEASRITGISSANICSCCNGKRNIAGGYHWQYV